MKKIRIGIITAYWDGATLFFDKEGKKPFPLHCFNYWEHLNFLKQIS